MAHTTQIGKNGEQIACAYLVQLGFDILACNYRYRRMEVDIIAMKDSVLHFVEVKSRTQSTFGLPEEAVDRSKIERMLAVAEHFQYHHEGETTWKSIQFDIISIQFQPSGNPHITYIHDIYI